MLGPELDSDQDGLGFEELLSFGIADLEAKLLDVLLHDGGSEVAIDHMINDEPSAEAPWACIRADFDDGAGSVEGIDREESFDLNAFALETLLEPLLHIRD